MSAGADKPPFKGEPVVLGGVTYIMPALSFGALEDTKGFLELIAAGGQQDMYDLQAAFVDVIHSALLRNYPDMARDTVRNSIGWDTAPQLFQLLMDLSVPIPAAGESRAVSPSGESTGTQP